MPECLNACREPGFLEKAVDILGAGEPIRPRHLDRDQPVQLLVFAEVDSAEVSDAQ